MSDEDIKKTGEELNAFADDMSAKFDAAAKKHARTIGRLRVFLVTVPTSGACRAGCGCRS